MIVAARRVMRRMSREAVPTLEETMTNEDQMRGAIRDFRQELLDSGLWDWMCDNVSEYHWLKFTKYLYLMEKSADSSDSAQYTVSR